MTAPGPASASEPEERTVAVVVVNFGSSALLERNLAPLTGSCPWVLAVVVDNYSTRPERERVRSLAAAQSWHLVEQSRNMGFGSGANAGVAAAAGLGAERLVLLNPDAVITCKALVALRDALDQRPRSLVAPVLRRPDGSVWSARCALDLDRGRTLSRAAQLPPAHEMPWLSGACLATSVEAWEAIGGFDEDYFLYWEDVDLCARAFEAGVEVHLADGVTAVHEEGGTQEQLGGGDFSWDYYRYNIRNRLLFAAKHLDDRGLRRWYRHSAVESYRVLLRGGGRRKFLRPWRPVACAVSACYQGWRAARRLRRPAT